MSMSALVYRSKALTSRAKQVSCRSTMQDFPELMDTEQAAAYLGLSPRTLRQWRYEGRGPAYIKGAGGTNTSVRYLKADLDQWRQVRERRIVPEAI